jgi:hypothetical protein
MNEIRKAKALLGHGGLHWIKNDLYNDARTKFCMVGAVEWVAYSEQTNLTAAEIDLRYLSNAAERTRHVLRVLGEVIKEQYPDRLDSENVVPYFNDHSKTRWTDVERVLDKAALKLDEQQPWIETVV